jgi:hypothetical protein
LTVFAIGAGAHNLLGQVLRDAGALAALLACFAAMFLHFDFAAQLEPWVLPVYPLTMALLLMAYGLQFAHGFSMKVGALVAAWCLMRVGSVLYAWLRQIVTGLDYLAISLAIFVLAILVSLSKSRVLRRLLAERVGRDRE